MAIIHISSLTHTCIQDIAFRIYAEISNVVLKEGQARRM